MNEYYENVKWIRGRAFYWNGNFVCSWYSTFPAPLINCRVNYMRTVRKWFPLASLIFTSGQLQASNTLFRSRKFVLFSLHVICLFAICKLHLNPIFVLWSILQRSKTHFWRFFIFQFFPFSHILLNARPNIQISTKTEQRNSKILSKATKFFRLLNFPNTTLARWSVVKAISKPKPNPFTFVSNSLRAALYPYLVRFLSYFRHPLVRKTNFYRWDFSVKLSTFSGWYRLVKCLSRRWYMCARSNERWKKGNSHWKSPSYLTRSTVFE